MLMVKFLASLTYVHRALDNNQLTVIKAHYFTDLSRENVTREYNSLTSL